MLDNLETKAIETALDMLFNRVIEALRNRRFWQRPRPGRIVRMVGAKFDDLILDLQPCFVLGERTSILGAFYESGKTRDEAWNRVHDVLNVVGAWFREWDSMRQVIGIRRSPEVLVRQFKSLNEILTHLGLAAGEVSKRFGNLAPGDYALVPYRATADRYNRFLTEYEALLRRLPQEVGILDTPPLGGERFFIRL